MMKKVIAFAFVTVTLISLSCMSQKSTTNSDGDWKPLLDGKTTSGWHSYGKEDAGSAWVMEDGTLHLDVAAKKAKGAGGGDLLTNEEYSNFHLTLEWKVAQGANSGIFFYVHEDKKYPYAFFTGLEMQVLDNERHPDAKIHKHRAGDLYDLIACKKEVVKPAGEWNKAEVKCKDGKVELYLNGTEVVETTLWDDNWKKMVAESKFKTMPDFGTYKTGKIALQDHGDDVWFRNIMIKQL
jgi:hypothetical protein